MSYRFWTEEDEAFLVAHYGKMTLAEIGHALGRTYGSVKSRVKCVDVDDPIDAEDKGYQPNACRLRIMAWAFRLRRVEDREDIGYAGPPLSMRMERQRSMITRRRGVDREMLSINLGREL